jgi:hypothetical protein
MSAACESTDWQVVGGGEPPALGDRSGSAVIGPGSENARLRSRIAELERELERIRATLKP